MPEYLCSKRRGDIRQLTSTYWMRTTSVPGSGPGAAEGTGHGFAPPTTETRAAAGVPGVPGTLLNTLHVTISLPDPHDKIGRAHV